MGQFGHVKVQFEGQVAILTDMMTGQRWPVKAESWRAALETEGVFVVALCCADRTEYFNDKYEAVNAALAFAGAAYTVCDHRGRPLATVTHYPAGAVVVWADDGRIDRWRDLTAEGGKLVGFLNGRFVQV